MLSDKKKKGTKGVTEMVPFKKEHILKLFTSKGCI